MATCPSSPSLIGLCSILLFLGSVGCGSDDGKEETDEWLRDAGLDTAVEDGSSSDDDADEHDDGGLPSPDSDDDPRSDSEKAAIALAESFCEMAFTCPKSTATVEISIQGFLTVAECKEAARRQPRAFAVGEPGGFIHSLLSPRIEPDLDDADACLAGIKSAVCDRSVPNDEAFSECEGFFNGQAQRGDPCLVEFECGNGLICSYESDSEACAGTCQPNPDVVCGSTTCAADEFCDTTDQAPTCRQRIGEYAECDLPRSCVQGARCIGVQGQGPGECIPYGSLGQGETCDYQDAVCKEGLACVDDTCQPISLVEQGANCHTLAKRCNPSLSCEPRFTDESATCQRAAQVGESCTTSSGGPTCVNTAYCSQNEVCENPRAIGETCAYDRQCATGNCDTGTCKTATVCSIAN